MKLLEVTEDDLVVRTIANEDVATTFCTLEQLEGALRLRLDSGVWEDAGATDRIKAAIQVYAELVDLPWLRDDWRRSNQRRDAGSLLCDGAPRPCRRCTCCRGPRSGFCSATACG